MSDKPKDPEKGELSPIVIPELGLPPRRGASPFMDNFIRKLLFSLTESEEKELREWRRKTNEKSFQREVARQQYEEQQADSSPDDEGEEPTP